MFSGVMHVPKGGNDFSWNISTVYAYTLLFEVQDNMVSVHKRCAD